MRVDGVAVRLAGREFELAAKLASDPQRVFTKTELLRDVWGIRTTGIRTRTVDSHASRLRRKLEAAGASTSSSTSGAWGTGYCCEVGHRSRCPTEAGHRVQRGSCGGEADAFRDLPSPQARDQAAGSGSCRIPPGELEQRPSRRRSFSFRSSPPP